MTSNFVPVKHRFVFKLLLAVLIMAVMVIGLASCDAGADEDKAATLAIEHFSVIEGTTWSGAHDRAGER